MPTNLYGSGDNHHPENSNVPAALIRRIHEAEENGLPKVAVWGSGKPCREFLAVDDLADARVFVMRLAAKTPLHDSLAEAYADFVAGGGRDREVRHFCRC
jgi:GDP-L-fucose synthase